MRKNIFKQYLLWQNIVWFSLIAIICQIYFWPSLSALAPAAAANDMCTVDVDAVLVMDSSGSMDEGAMSSQCDWWELKWIDPSFQWVFHTDYDVTQAWCDAKSLPPHRPSAYTPAVLNKMETAQQAAKTFIDYLRTNDQSALVSFNTIAQLKKVLSNNHLATKTAIDNLLPQGATNIGDAIAAASDELGSSQANPQAAKTLILLTDGKANKPFGSGYGEDAQDVAYALQKAQEASDLGYRIFSIGLGDGTQINEIMLEQIANIGGGKYYHAPQASDLEQIYETIAWEVCQYGSISGCKYQDSNLDGEIQGEEKLAGWEILLTGDANLSQLTDEEGCYVFAGLLPGSYTMAEGENLDQQPFLQTYPLQDDYEISLMQGENVTDIDFANADSSLCQVAEEVPGQCVADGLREFTYYYNYEYCGLPYTQDVPDVTCQEPPEPVCGNNIIEGNEECDDGNLINGDGCSDTCLIEQTPEPICGNQILETGEECDDGNLEDGDGCSTLCQIEQTPINTGDIVINEIMQNPAAVSDTAGEWFELYNTADEAIDLAGCLIRDNSSDNHLINNSLIVVPGGYAVLARNGDPALNGGLTPDYVYAGFTLGNTDDEIILECQSQEIDRVEYDGGPNFPDPTGASMILANPFLDNNFGSNWCISSSVYGNGDLGTPGVLNDICGQEPELICGNNIIEGNEECDDGNLVNGDGCSDVCLIEVPPEPVCGNQVLEIGEECDDGNLINEDGCSDTCFIEQAPEPICGNQILETDEECDDGNLINGDGCSGLCQIEQVPARQISGCKYYDRNKNRAVDQDEEQLSDWPMSLKKYEAEQWLQVATTTTQQIGEDQGCYLFSDLGPGIYQVSETLPASADWQQTYPLDPDFWQIDLTLDTATTTANFLNYLPLCGNDILDDSEQCDDGNLVNGDGCSAVCLIEKAPEPPTRGESGGSSVLVLTIFNELINVIDENQANFSWQTNYPATSQVVYSAQGQNHLLDINGSPNYGYASVSTKNNQKTTTHSLDMTGLDTCATYYCRFVSEASPPAFSKELVFTTNCPQPESISVPPPPVEETGSQGAPPQEIAPISRVETTEETGSREIVEEPEEPAGEKHEEPLIIAPQEPEKETKTTAEEDQELEEDLEEIFIEEEQDRGFLSSLLAALGNLFEGINIGWLLFLIILLALIIYGIVVFRSRKKKD